MTDFKDVDEALADLQGVLPVIRKASTGNAGGRATKYADLADICREVLPLTSARGLAWTTRPTLTRNDEGASELVLFYSLRHAASGTSIDGEYPLGTGGPQQLGSAITYARRYTFCAVTGVVADEDDDGTAAQKAAERKPRSTPERAPAALPRNRDGQISRSQTTDDEKTAAGLMTDAQQRAHNQLERDTRAGSGPAERLTATPEDDPWLLPAPKPAGRPDGVIHAHFKRLGFTDQQRDARLGAMSSITGRTVTSTSDLSAAEGLAVMRFLEQCRDEGALAERLLAHQAQETP